MAVVQSQYTKASNDIHLRDWRHARNLYYEYGLAFAPKTKFLYHCLFEPSPEIGNSATVNAFAFQKQLGVLVKSADLPSFRISVENKKQYNRIKQFQTRIDYQDVNITFHDDNLGLTRALFEEYYKYNFLDGRHNPQKGAIVAGPYASRDKYSPTVPKYGLNTGNIGPFFNSITIYQLARQQYFAYTLVNPIVTQWNHGDVAYEDGSGLNENAMSIAYESVIFSNGDIGENSEPVAFTDPETGYDQSPSPISEPDLRGRGNQYVSGGPKLLEPAPPTDPTVTRKTTVSSSTTTTFTSTTETEKTYSIPKKDTKNEITPVPAPKENDYPPKDANTIQKKLDNRFSSRGPNKKRREKARKTFAMKAINAGELPYDSYVDFTKQVPSKRERDAIINAKLAETQSNKKLSNLASEAIDDHGVK